mmetsp:Transcript_71387/g.107938  ORF Transcript_71387/g.107938 Transcript_71387/m.107938 type:complete len:226 (+) Transcript_71387:176-853(+)
MPQIDRFVRRGNKKLWLRSFLVILVKQRPTCRLLKGLLYTLRRFRRCFKVWQGLRTHDRSTCRGAAPFFGRLWRYQSILGLIHFIPQHYKRKYRRRISQSLQSTPNLIQKFLSPVIQIVQRMWVGNVIHQKTRIGSSIKSDSQTLKAFLTGRIPNLQRHQMPLAVHVRDDYVFLTQKVRPDRRLVLPGELAGGISIHQGRLADARIPKDDDLQCLLVRCHDGIAF